MAYVAAGPTPNYDDMTGMCFVDGDRVTGGVSGDAHERALDRSEVASSPVASVNVWTRITPD